MLDILIDGVELYDERTSTFIEVKPTKIKLEHSLISISEWESKWHKPFLDDKPKTDEEFLDYIRCMTITQNVDPNAYLCISAKNRYDIKKYMDDTMTATWFKEDSNKSLRGKQRAITSELIYCWMITLGIPDRFEQWHLNRLLTLIKVCNIENTPKKKMKEKDILRQNSALNASRRRMGKTRG